MSTLLSRAYSRFVSRMSLLNRRFALSVQSFAASRNFARLLALIIAFAECFGSFVFNAPMTPNGQALDLSGYTLVLEDDFEGSNMDTSVWEYRATGPRRSGFNSPQQVRVENGNLIIKASYRSDIPGREGWNAGMVNTKQRFINGYFEIRCKCSIGGGFWSAFWLNSLGMSSAEASDGGVGGAEIDIFEAFNYKKPFVASDSVSQNIHVGGYGDGLRSEMLGNYFGNNIYTEYNTYGLEWTQDQYIFYINGIETVRSSFSSGVSAAEEYAIISLEVPDRITAEQGFETEFLVDYVRIYQKIK